MGNQSRTESDKGGSRRQQQDKPPQKTDSAIPEQFKRDPAEGSRETVQRNLDKKPS